MISKNKYKETLKHDCGSIMLLFAYLMNWRASSTQRFNLSSQNDLIANDKFSLDILRSHDTFDLQAIQLRSTKKVVNGCTRTNLWGSREPR